MHEGLLDAFRGIVGSEHVLTEPGDCAPYEVDWRRRFRGRALCVVKPGDTEQVAEIVRTCAAADVAIVPQGGNTSHCGGSVPRDTGQEVILSLLRMNRVREVDTQNNTITVEAGCVLATVQGLAAKHNLLFPLSLAAEGSCVIGGNLATNAGGVQVLRYGNMRELTLGLEVVLADGRVWDGLRGLRKDNTGYDLRDLFIGSEGTLGVITAAVLKLFPAPTSRVVAWLAVEDISQAIILLHHMRRTCADRVSAFEVVSDTAFGLVLRHIFGAVNPLGSRYSWYVLAELSDSTSDTELRECMELSIAAAMEAGTVLDAALAMSEAQATALWRLREDIAEAQRLEGVSIKHDVSVPISRIPDFVTVTGEMLEHSFPGVRVAAFGHVGDGNIHYNVSMSSAEPNAALVERSLEVNRVVHDNVAAVGGSISAEHGVGQLKREEIVRYKSSVEIELMRKIKAVFDPQCIFNPGKVL